MPSDEELRKQRAAARASWPGRKLSLADEGTTDDLSTLTVSQRIALVWRLTQDAWAFAGTPIPDYTRAETPIRVIRARDRT